MKRVIIFIGLKIAEIAGIVVIPYGLGWMLLKWEWFSMVMRINTMPYYLVGILVLLVVMMASAIMALISEVIYANWEWAKKLSRGKQPQPLEEGNG